MIRTHHGLAALLAALGLACQARSEATGYSEIGDLVAHGDYRFAVQRAARLVKQDPDDPEAREAHRRASVAYLLEQGRRATFEDRDQDALEFFDRAMDLDPDAEQPHAWHQKTRRKLGQRWFVKARDLHIADELEAALEAYEHATTLDPDLQFAREGMSRVLIQINHRAGLGDEYYIEGVRALHEYWLQVARSRFQYSDKYDRYGNGDERARRRVAEVDRMLSQRRTAVARSLEAEGLYHASRNEFKLAYLLDPENTEAGEGRDRMEIESQAARLADAAEMMILRGEFGRAREKIAEGLEITTVQKEVFAGKLVDIDDARAQVKYEHALDLERDFRYTEAIVIYEELLAEREWYEDARSRLSTLQDYVVHAAELYQKAMDASSTEERVSFLRQIESFWPEYQDAHKLLEALDPTGD